MSTISSVSAREILDSRGHPALEVDVLLSDGSHGRAAVPSGASTGRHEAKELRDGDEGRYKGQGLLRAVENVQSEIAPAISGLSALDQDEVDDLLIELDGTPDKSRLGGNAIVGVSMAVAHAAAGSSGIPLYRYFSAGGDVTLPVPMFNVLNGGKHADNSTDIQEFMVVPAGFETFRRAVQAGAEVYQALKRMIGARGLSTTLGDEGGFAPEGISNRDALDLVLAAIEAAGYDPERDCLMALDVAASELVSGEGLYRLARDDAELSAGELIQLYDDWLDAYPICSIEDGLSEDDWDGWTEMATRLGDRVQLVGDDLYTTDPDRIAKGIQLEASNAILVKLNQVGTVSETLEAMRTAREAGWGTVISHRSGETEDTTVADLAVGAAAGQIKAGAPSRGERTAKYNRLLRIEEELGKDAVFAGRQQYEKYTRWHTGSTCAEWRHD